MYTELHNIAVIMCYDVYMSSDDLAAEPSIVHQTDRQRCYFAGSLGELQLPFADAQHKSLCFIS